MHFDCHTCGAGYRVPTSRVADAGPSGLRVRCKKCRAIMVWSEDRQTDGKHDDTSPALPHLRRASVELTDVHAAAAVNDPIPAAVKASGAIDPLPHVVREITGVHLPKVRRRSKKACWFAGIAGRPRGPYTRAEMCQLAREGKVRGSTLVWTPGFAQWLRVRAHDGEDATLAWLRDEVLARKQWEKDAARRAREAMGVVAIEIPHALSAPPPLPADAFDADEVAEAVAGSFGNGWVLAAVLFGLVMTVVFYTLPSLGVSLLPQ